MCCWGSWYFGYYDWCNNYGWDASVLLLDQHGTLAASLVQTASYHISARSTVCWSNEACGSSDSGTHLRLPMANIMSFIYIFAVFFGSVWAHTWISTLDLINVMKIKSVLIYESNLRQTYFPFIDGEDGHIKPSMELSKVFSCFSQAHLTTSNVLTSTNTG